MSAKCKAEWCPALPVDGSPYCAIHTKMPPLNNFESHSQWLTRTRRAKAAAKRAAERAAESDEKLAKRGQ